MTPERPGTLHVVATPIGNLEDLSPRAAATLQAVDWVLCEDTRHSAILLRRVGSAARTLSLNAQNEAARIPTVLAALQQGQMVALVSDAGTPCLSDPGARLCAAVHEAGLPVRTVPGPFAAAAGLAASGLAPQPFAFWGFLPKRSAARRTALAARLRPDPDGDAMTHAFYVPGRDLVACLRDVAAVAATARVVVARELTKIHEGYLRGTAGDLAASLPEEVQRGEAVLLIEVEAAVHVGEATPPALDDELRALSGAADRKEALRALAKRSGLSRRVLYQRLLALGGAAPLQGDAEDDGAPDGDLAPEA